MAIGSEYLLEEETLPDYLPTRYYPIQIGQLLGARYQVVGKLGFGTTSTAWLARDLPGHRHVALKVSIQSGSYGGNVSQELQAYERFKNGPANHPGRAAIRTVLDSFTLPRVDGSGEHLCLVHPPLWDSMKGFLKRNPAGRVPTPILAYTLLRMFQALDYARECRVIHTDIQTANIALGIRDTSIFETFEEAEIEYPVPRKEIDRRFIYASRPLEFPEGNGIDLPVLCDFGSSVWGEQPHKEDVQPDVYRAPEVILQSPWSYQIDIWNLGCVVWDLYEGKHLFRGVDPEHGVYRSRAHLAEMIALLGPPPRELLEKSKLKSKFFSDQGEFNAGIEIPPSVTLESLETNLEGEDKKLFLGLMRKMLQWDPKMRHTPKQLLEDEWIQRHTAS
ncbi:hypothetical protein EST38_g1753 [Candolleomyces aberdarensis]|uniref:Protein kinase domain-containing protein n=1 Tax=Candolleomyces aberdarensis TaxID=2316362 RepID=A0A4Q2DV70_9AGAR|nr:hypothetical protein EST38_g1753 [Candolleomyces aberdarensis]